MNCRLLKTNWVRPLGLTLFLLLVLVFVSGCQTVRFYRQAIKGQYQLFARAQPVEKLLADPSTPLPLKERLGLLQNLRSFALTQLKLPVDGHYRKYADLHRRFVVWNVQAAPEFSLQPKTWWYPLVGSLAYRGYFSEQGARDYADLLRKKGLDVSSGGVIAYSTLGWFKDPVLNTFLFEPDSDLAETIFHELGHQRVFARGDTDFNEAFATTVGQEGARRWLRSLQDPAANQDYELQLQRNAQFVHLVLQTRLRLEALYGDVRNDEGKTRATDKMRSVPRDRLRRDKQLILYQLHQDYAKLKNLWGGDSSYDAWFARQVNNAKLNSIAAYYDLVPCFERLLALNGSDLEKFYQAAERLAHMPKKERHQSLRSLDKPVVSQPK